MLLLPLAAAAGAVLGWCRGGRLGRLAGLRLRTPILVWSAVAVQAWLGVTGSMAWPFAGRFPALVLTYLAVGLWLAINARAHPALALAFAILAAGWFLNVAAIVANGGMPVSRPAMAAVGIPPDTPIDEGNLGKHRPAEESTTLPWLGDVIPVPPLASVISVGDVLMAVGVAIGLVRAMEVPAEPEILVLPEPVM